MNYQKVLCIGDSQTFGARTYGCYPLHLARILTAKTPYAWQTINRSTNGHTARDLWFRLPGELDAVRHVFQTCLLIGTNDVGEGKPLELFTEYYRQILRALCIAGMKAVYCAEIPPIHADGHVFFSRDTIERRLAFNAAIRQVVEEFPNAWLTKLGELDRDCYEDPVHFNEAGNIAVAEAFAAEIARH